MCGSVGLCAKSTEIKIIGWVFRSENLDFMGYFDKITSCIQIASMLVCAPDKAMAHFFSPFRLCAVYACASINRNISYWFFSFFSVELIILLLTIKFHMSSG